MNLTTENKSPEGLRGGAIEMNGVINCGKKLHNFLSVKPAVNFFHKCILI